MHQFSTYILPEHAKFIYSSRVNKLKIFKINGERRLFKDNKEVLTLFLQEAASNILSFILQSVDRDKSQTKKNVETVLLGPNSSTFDTSVFLRNSGATVIERLRKMDICFADSLALFKTQNRKNCHVWKMDGAFPKLHHSSLYSFLFAKSSKYPSTRRCSCAPKDNLWITARTFFEDNNRELWSCKCISRC